VGPNFAPPLGEVNIFDIYNLEEPSITDVRLVRLYETNQTRKRLGYGPKKGTPPVSQEKYEAAQQRVACPLYLKENIYFRVVAPLIQWRKDKYELFLDGYEFELPVELLARLERFESKLSEMSPTFLPTTFGSQDSHSVHYESSEEDPSYDEIERNFVNPLPELEELIISQGSIPEKGSTYVPPFRRPIPVHGAVPDPVYKHERRSSRLSKDAKKLGIAVGIAKSQPNYIVNIYDYVKEYSEYPELDECLVQGYYLRNGASTASLLRDVETLRSIKAWDNFEPKLPVFHILVEQPRFANYLVREIVRGLPWTMAEESLLQDLSEEISSDPRTEGRWDQILPILWEISRDRCEILKVPKPRRPIRTPELS